MKMPLIAIEILLGFGVPIGWGVWELWSLRREKANDRLKAEHAAAHEETIGRPKFPHPQGPRRGPAWPVGADDVSRRPGGALRSDAASETATASEPRPR